MRTVPASLGHYQLGDVIGDGGMGTVYAAVDTRFARKVAVKLLHAHLARSPEVVRRFRTEAVIGAKLSHPHVVRVYDVLEAEGFVGFVMEHVDGKSLDRLLAERPGGLAAEEALRLFRQVVSGVAHAHAAGLVHRDIKPSNVLVGVVDGEPHAKVTDFGVAKVAGGETHLTGLGAKIGTLAYMSPEQIDNPASVDARSDVYALGVLGYELLTGQVPFDGGTEFEVMRRILSGERRASPGVAAKVRGPFAAALERCLATSREERYGDARTLLAALVSRDRGAAPVAQPFRGIGLIGDHDARPEVHAGALAVAARTETARSHSPPEPGGVVASRPPVSHSRSLRERPVVLLLGGLVAAGLLWGIADAVTSEHAQRPARTVHNTRYTPPDAAPTTPNPSGAVGREPDSWTGPVLVERVSARESCEAYPAAARREGVEGEVSTSFLVKEDGSLDEIEVFLVNQPGMGFEDAARTLLQRFRYLPATRNGRAEVTREYYVFTFRPSMCPLSPDQVGARSDGGAVRTTVQSTVESQAGGVKKARKKAGTSYW